MINLSQGFPSSISKTSSPIFEHKAGRMSVQLIKIFSNCVDNTSHIFFKECMDSLQEALSLVNRPEDLSWSLIHVHNDQYSHKFQKLLNNSTEVPVYMHIIINTMMTIIAPLDLL